MADWTGKFGWFCKKIIKKWPVVFYQNMVECVLKNRKMGDQWTKQRKEDKKGEYHSWRKPIKSYN